VAAVRLLVASAILEVRRHHRQFAICLAMALLGSCANTRSDPYPTVILPGKPSPAVLPIRDPILRPDLAVEALVHGPGGKTAAIWLLLDSGATIGLLPTAVAADLRLTEERPATMLAINGAARTSLVVVPRLDLGELAVSRVAFLLNTLAGPAQALGVAEESVRGLVPETRRSVSTGSRRSGRSSLRSWRPSQGRSRRHRERRKRIHRALDEPGHDGILSGA
jgi:hypothetical protein